MNDYRKAAQKPGKAPPIDWHIGALVLTGMPYSDSHRIGPALERELTRLLRRQGLPPALAKGGEIKGMRTESLDTGRYRTADAFGKGLAKSIYSGLKHAAP
jgi:hypothetical protein